MGKDKLSNNIEDGLFNFYTLKEDDATYSPDSNFELYSRYENLAKKILFKAKAQANKSRFEKIISFEEASKRIAKKYGENKDNVIPLFKKHIQSYGLAANYRNLDKMSLEEITELLIQIDFTSLLDEIESSEDDKRSESSD